MAAQLCSLLRYFTTVTGICMHKKQKEEANAGLKDLHKDGAAPGDGRSGGQGAPHHRGGSPRR